MTTRERFLRIFRDRDPSVHALKWEFGYWGGTINKWYKQGLPRVNPARMPGKITTPTATLYLHSWKSENKYVQPDEYPEGYVHTAGGLAWPTQGLCLDNDVREFFDMNNTQRVIDCNLLFYPMFDILTEHEDDERMVYRDIDGVKKIFAKKEAVIPTPLEYPVWDWASWNLVKTERLRIDNIRERLPANWDKLVEEYRNRDYPLGIGGLPFGIFGTPAHILGYETLFVSYYDEPELIHDMMETFTEVWIALLKEILKDVQIDFIEFWEDISGNQGCMVSPTTMREFMVPYYKKMTQFGKENGIEIFFVDTDGDCSQIIPVFLEGGINAMYPFEVHAGMDVLKVRKEYPQLAVCGGIDKLAINKGKDQIEKMLENVKETLKLGGYVPHGDHLIPPEVEFENFKYYRRRLNEIIDEVGNV